MYILLAMINNYSSLLLCYSITYLLFIITFGQSLNFQQLTIAFMCPGRARKTGLVSQEAVWCRPHQQISLNSWAYAPGWQGCCPSIRCIRCPSKDMLHTGLHGYWKTFNGIADRSSFPRPPFFKDLDLHSHTELENFIDIDLYAFFKCRR